MRNLIFFSLFFVLLSSFGWSRTKVHPSGLEVTFPDAWKIEITDDELYVHESDESAGVVLTVVDANDLNEAAQDVTEELNKWVAQAKTIKRLDDASLNGLEATFIEGSGYLDGEQAKWLVVFVKHKNIVLMILGVGELPEWDPEKGDIIDIIKSVRAP